MATFNGIIGATADDGFTTVTSLATTINPHFIGNNAGVQSYASFLRFTNVTIPKGSTITSAILTLQAAQTDNRAGFAVRVGVVDADNQAFPANGTAALALAFAGTAATWNGQATTVNTDYNSPDFTNSMQALINRGGWASGNALVAMIRDNSATSYRSLKDYTNTTTLCARLTVGYTSASASRLPLLGAACMLLQLSRPARRSAWRPARTGSAS